MTILTPESSQPRSHSPQQLRWMRWIAIALVVLALCFRLTGLDRKVYWHDEAYTSLVITAHPGKYFREDLFQNRLVTASDLLAYPQLSPELTWTSQSRRPRVRTPEAGRYPARAPQALSPPLAYARTSGAASQVPNDRRSAARVLMDEGCTHCKLGLRCGDEAGIT